MSIFRRIYSGTKKLRPGSQAATALLGPAAKASLALALASLFAGTSCKEVKPEPKATATATPNSGSSPTSMIGTTPVPTPLVDPRCAQTQAFACNVAADLVELCKTKETDTTPCTQSVWPKALFDKMVAIQSGKDVPLEECKADPLFVATDTDPLNLREKPDENATILAEVPRREAVKCLGLTGFWAKVKTDDGKEGFMKAEFLSSAKPAANTTGGTGGNNNNSGTTSTSPKPSTAPAPAGNTIECSRWIFQETKTESTFAGSTCDDKNNDTWSLFGAKNKWLNCVKVGVNMLGIWQCRCDRFQEEIKWMPIAECKSPWSPRN